MRNYLKFNEKWNDNNIVDNINKLYFYIKKDYINHENKLKKYKNHIKNETDYFYKLTNSINQDFENKIKMHNLNNTNNLSNQYKDIIIQTDSLYNNKINELNNKINQHNIKNNIFIEILKTVYKYLKLYVVNSLKIKKLLKNKQNEKNYKSKEVNKLLIYENFLNNNIKNSIENILQNQSKENKTELYSNSIYDNNIGNLSKKIIKISNIIENNKLVKENLKQNINNSKDINTKKMLELLYNNNIYNNTLLEKKLQEYLVKINQATNLVENNIKNNKNNRNNRNNKVNILIFNKKNIKLNKVKELIDKFKKLQY